HLLPQLYVMERDAARGLRDAAIVEGLERVRPQLDAGAGLADGRSLFEQDQTDAFLREPRRCGEPADAAARDQDRSFACHQLAFPRCSRASSARSGTRDASLLRSTSCVNSAIKVLRSAGFNGCSIRAWARSTDGMMSRNSAAPDLVR